MVADIIGKCRKIVTHFNHSAIACTKLKIIQENLKLQPHKLIQDVQTRWNSTYYMLERLHEQRQAVTAYAAEHDIPTLTAYQWGLVENVIRVLKPFEEITKQASQDSELISFVIPAVATLHSYLSKRQKDSGVQTLKDNLKESLEKRFLKTEHNSMKLDEKFFTFATLLDPRYKTKFLKDPKQVKQELIKEIIEHDKRIKKATETENPQTDADNNKATSSTMVANKLDKEIYEDIWDCFEEIVKPASTNSDDNSSSADELSQVIEVNLEASNSSEVSLLSPTPTKLSKTKKQCTLELDNYLDQSNISRTDRPLNWWKNSIGNFSSLKPMVLKYLSAPPSSVASERLFSAAGQVYADNRSKLLPSNAEKLIFIMKNLKYSNDC